MKKVKHLLLFLIVLSSCIFAQKQTKPVSENFGWGNCWYLNLDYKDYQYQRDLDPYAVKGIVSKDSVLLIKNNRNLDLKTFFISERLKSIIAKNSMLNEVDLSTEKFKKSLILESDTLKTDVIMSQRNSNVNMLKFVKCTINGINLTDSIIFHDVFMIFNSKVQHETRFLFATFEKKTDMRRNQFHSLFSVENSIFKDETAFRDSRFENAVYFTSVDFRKSVRFPRVKFADKIEFARVIFHDTIDFSWTQFSNAVDLRRCDFKNVKAVYLENIVYPEGRLYVDWDQLKAVNGEHWIRLSMASVSDKWDNYKRLALIYEKLRDNFTAQGRKEEADNVMYELAVYKNELVGNLSSDLYGFFLGFGYRPWRFITLLVLPMIFIWALIYYFFFYGVVIRIVSPNFKGSNPPKLTTPYKEKKLFNKFHLKLYDHKMISPAVGKLERLWHVVYFSSTVLLSVRFKNDWLVEVPDDTLGKKCFLIFISIQWAFGIGLYILFGLKVLSSQFTFVKGLLGI